MPADPAPMDRPGVYAIGDVVDTPGPWVHPDVAPPASPIPPRAAPAVVAAGHDRLSEVPTGRVVPVIPGPYDGTVPVVLVPEGTTARVGTPLVRLRAPGAPVSGAPAATTATRSVAAAPAAVASVS